MVSTVSVVATKVVRVAGRREDKGGGWRRCGYCAGGNAEAGASTREARQYGASRGIRGQRRGHCSSVLDFLLPGSDGHGAGFVCGRGRVHFGRDGLMDDLSESGRKRNNIRLRDCNDLCDSAGRGIE